MSNTFSAGMVLALSDTVLLNRAVYGGPDYFRAQYLDDYDAARDPDAAGNREALFVYDRYDSYLKTFGYKTLTSADLGFDSSEISASDVSDGFDQNYTYAGGLYRNNYVDTGVGATTPFTGAGAVALVNTKETDAGKTLYLTFRGTDADGPTADGEAGTANGQVRYYEQLRDLIDHVYDYVSDAENGVTDIVVSGHSLGGAVADLFALYDGARFDSIDGVKLKVIALASAGVDPGVLGLMSGYDQDLVNVGGGGITFNTPDWYFQYDQANDIVRNPGQYDYAAHLSADPTQAPITAAAVTLLQNKIHFDDNRLQFETPMIDQYAASKNLDTNFLVNHYADLYEMIGTEFSKSWSCSGDVAYDRYIALFGSSHRLDGTVSFNNVNGFGVAVDNEVNYAGEKDSLYILGLSGNDTIHSGGAKDFVAGGEGDDLIQGGGHADILLGDIKGQAGDDRLYGGKGADILFGGGGDDLLRGGGGVDSFVFASGFDHDVIADFDWRGGRHDLIDLSDMRGIDGWHDLKTAHIQDDGSSLIIQTNKSQNTLTLEHVSLIDLDRGDFIF